MQANTYSSITRAFLWSLFLISWTSSVLGGHKKNARENDPSWAWFNDFPTGELKDMMRESFRENLEMVMQKAKHVYGQDNSSCVETYDPIETPEEHHKKKTEVRAYLDSKRPLKSNVGSPALILVVGPESTGNRYIVKLIVESAGCHGKSGHVQPLDHKGSGRNKDWSALDLKTLKSIKNSVKCAVLHRSYPHNNHFVNMARMAQTAMEYGFDVRVLVLERYMPAVIDSQVQRKHVSTKAEAREHIKRAYLEIYDDIIEAEIGFTKLNYEYLQEEDYLDWMFEEIGLNYDPQKIPPFTEENTKHFNGISTKKSYS